MTQIVAKSSSLMGQKYPYREEIDLNLSNFDQLPNVVYERSVLMSSFDKYRSKYMVIWEYYIWAGDSIRVN